jgi:hypothetical protein
MKRRAAGAPSRMQWLASSISKDSKTRRAERFAVSDHKGISPTNCSHICKWRWIVIARKASVKKKHIGKPGVSSEISPPRASVFMKVAAGCGWSTHSRISGSRCAACAVRLLSPSQSLSR